MYLLFAIIWLLYINSRGLNFRNFLSFSSVFILCGFVAFRGLEVGADTPAYVEFFNSPHYIYLGDKTDFGFEFIASCLRIFSNNPYYFVFVISAIYMFGVSFLISKLSKDVPLSVLMFCLTGTTGIFLFHYLTIMRQATSLAFFFIAVYLFFKDEDEGKSTHIKSSLICYTIAVSIHFSTLFTLPFLYIIRISKIKPSILIIVVLLTYLLGAQQWIDIKGFLDTVFSFLGNDSHYSSYADVSFGQRDVVGLFNMNILPFSLLAIFMALTIKEETLNIWYVKMFLMAVILNNVFSNNIMWDRLILGFSMFVIVAIPRVIEDMRPKVKWSFLFVFFLYYVYKTMGQLISTYELYKFTKMNLNFIPYHNWFLGI